MKWKILVVSCTILSCKDPQVPPPPTGLSCKAAAENLTRLAREQNCTDKRGRPVGAPNARGESYQSVCERVEREGMVSMRSDCIASAKTCEEERACQAQ